MCIFSLFSDSPTNLTERIKGSPLGKPFLLFIITLSQT